MSWYGEFTSWLKILKMNERVSSTKEEGGQSRSHRCEWTFVWFRLLWTTAHTNSEKVIDVHRHVYSGGTDMHNVPVVIESSMHSLEMMSTFKWRFKNGHAECMMLEYWDQEVHRRHWHWLKLNHGIRLSRISRWLCGQEVLTCFASLAKLPRVGGSGIRLSVEWKACSGHPPSKLIAGCSGSWTFNLQFLYRPLAFCTLISCDASASYNFLEALLSASRSPLRNAEDGNHE